MIYDQYKGLTFYEMTDRMVKKYGDKPAISYSEGGTVQTVTYNGLFKDILVLAGYFSDKNLKGKYIAIDMRNTYNQAIAAFAAMAMGAVAVILNFDLPEDDIRYALEKVEPDILITDPEDEDFEFDGKPGMIRLSSDGDISHILSEGAPLAVKPHICESDPAAILMTSGSTSRSKLVILPQSAMLPTSDVKTRRSLVTFPLYHVAGIKFFINDLCYGAHTCLSDFRRAISDIGWFRPNEAIAIPLLVSALVKYSKKGLCDLSCFKNIDSGGAPQDLESKKYLNSLGIFSVSFYGTTETSGTNTVSYPETFKDGSVGKPGGRNEIKISPEGEVLVRGKNVMLGYLGDEAATKEAFDGDWYKTGDIGKIDEDGFLFITGRIKNIIILSNGENVSPEAIENRIYRCGTIDEVVAYAENDEIHLGVYCEDMNQEKREEIEKFIKAYNQSVPTYHRIKKIDFRDKPFEKTASNKIKRPKKVSEKC